MPLVLVGIGVLLTVWVSLAISKQNNTWATALVSWSFGWLTRLPWVGTKIEQAIVSLSKWIAHKFGNLFIAQANRVIGWIAGLAWYVRYVAELSLTWPVDLVTFARWLLTTELPHLIRSLPHASTKVIQQTIVRVRRVEKRIVTTGKLTPALVRAAVTAAFPGIALSLPSLRWLRKHWRALAALLTASAGAIAVPWGGLGRIERRTLNLGKRLTKVEKLLGVTTFALILSRVLRVTPRCVRDGGIGRTARRLCGMDQDLLTALLLGTGVVASLSVREIAEDAELLADEVFGILSRVIDEFPARGALALDGQTFPH